MLLEKSMAGKQKIDTIKDLARIAKVSTGSASMVMSNKWHKKVKPDVAEKILRIAREHNYVVNPLGRSLQQNKFFRIAIIMEGSFLDHPLIGTFSFHDFIGVASDRLSASGYSLDIIQLDKQQQEQIVKCGFFSKNVDAMIFLQWNTENPRRLFDKVYPVQPYMVIGNDFTARKWNCIYRDTEEMSRRAVACLTGNGHKRIAISRISGSRATFAAKVAGYKKALQAAGLEFDPKLVADLDKAEPSMKHGAQLAGKLMALKAPPTAFFCNDNVDALGLLVGLQKAGYKIPEQIEIIGYGDEAIANMAPLPLTYLKIPNKEMADIAIEYILTALDSKEPVAPLHKKVLEKLILQKTTR